MKERNGAEVALDIEALEYCCSNLREARHRTQVQRVEGIIERLKSQDEKGENPGTLSTRNYYIIPGL